MDTGQDTSPFCGILERTTKSVNKKDLKPNSFITAVHLWTIKCQYNFSSMISYSSLRTEVENDLLYTG